MQALRTLPRPGPGLFDLVVSKHGVLRMLKQRVRPFVLPHVLYLNRLALALGRHRDVCLLPDKRFCLYLRVSMPPKGKGPAKRARSPEVSDPEATDEDEPTPGEDDYDLGSVAAPESQGGGAPNPLAPYAAAARWVHLHHSGGHTYPTEGSADAAYEERPALFSGPRGTGVVLASGKRPFFGQGTAHTDVHHGEKFNTGPTEGALANQDMGAQRRMHGQQYRDMRQRQIQALQRRQQVYMAHRDRKLPPMAQRQLQDAQRHFRINMAHHRKMELAHPETAEERAERKKRIKAMNPNLTDIEPPYLPRRDFDGHGRGGGGGGGIMA